MEELNKLEERIRNRRRRRWKRRARIIAPFAALPLLLTTLILSVDFIEYKPEEPREKLTSRPLPKLTPPPPKHVDPGIAIDASQVSVDDIFKQARAEIPAIEGFEEGEAPSGQDRIALPLPPPARSSIR